jgi:DnaJ-class molecular chaperone
MQPSDYYGILGVEKSATQEQIKAAYRKLALEYHPDRNKNNPAAAHRMKEINESYAVLSDPGKRRQYDDLRRAYGSSAYSRFRQTHTEQDIFKGSDVHQIFEEISRAFGFRGFHEIFKEAYGPGYRTFEFRRPGGFARVFVSAHGAGRAARPNSVLQGPLGKLIKYGLKKQWGIELPERGKDVHDVITISQAMAVMGGRIRYVNRKNQKELIIRIPAGIRAGQKIRLKGMGESGKGGAEPGDLFVQVQIRRRLQQKARDAIKQLRNSIFPKRS